MRRAGGGRAWVTMLCVSGGVAGVWGCAEAPAMAPAPAAPATKEESREPATIEEAQAQLERARAQLAGEAPAGPSAAVRDATLESTGAGGATTSAESPPPPSKCGNACGAVRSMRRAVDAICRLAGDTDTRCTDARRTLKDSEAKLTGCGCPAP